MNRKVRQDVDHVTFGDHGNESYYRLTGVRIIVEVKLIITF